MSIYFLLRVAALRKTNSRNKACVQSKRNKSNVQEFKVFQIEIHLGKI